jgi:hypothetical protein
MIVSSQATSRGAVSAGDQSRSREPKGKLKMKRIFFSAIIALTAINAFAMPATAQFSLNMTLTLDCGPAIDDFSNPDPDQGIRIRYHNGNWSIIHTLGNGSPVDRADQFDVLDRVGEHFFWWGNGRRNPSLTMHGWIYHTVRGTYYHEELTDSAHGNAKLIDTLSRCTVIENNGPLAPIGSAGVGAGAGTP